MPNQVEGNIKLKTIKELKNHQSYLQKRLFQIEDKVNLLQLKLVQDLSLNIIDSNIKKDQIKDLQETKIQISEKIQGVDDQINRLLYQIANETENASDTKNQNIKN